MSHRRPHIGIKSRPATGREREGDLLKEANELPRNSARLEPTGAHVAKDLVQVKAELHKSTKRNIRLSEDIKALKDELGRVGGAFEEDITCPICSSIMWAKRVLGSNPDPRVDPYQLTPCGHGACGMCVVTWINTQNAQHAKATCPLCRQAVSSDVPILPNRVLGKIIDKWIGSKTGLRGGQWEGYAEWLEREEQWSAYKIANPELIDDQSFRASRRERSGFRGASRRQTPPGHRHPSGHFSGRSLLPRLQLFRGVDTRNAPPPELNAPITEHSALLHADITFADMMNLVDRLSAELTSVPLLGNRNHVAEWQAVDRSLAELEHRDLSERVQGAALESARGIDPHDQHRARIEAPGPAMVPRDVGAYRPRAPLLDRIGAAREGSSQNRRRCSRTGDPMAQ